MRNYYVYVHRKADTGEVFYVGKGFGRRAFRKSSRSVFWNKIVEKHGYTIEFIQTGIQEWYAFELEAELIAYYGRRDIDEEGTLCNLSDGGEGNSGMIRTEQFKKNLSNARKGKAPSPNTIAGRSKPIVRSDGVVYPSAAEAARSIRNERYPLANHFVILAVARKQKHCITAYGYKWEFLKDYNDRLGL